MSNEKRNGIGAFGWGLPSVKSSMIDPDMEQAPDFLSREACERLFAHAEKSARGGGEVRISLRSSWTANIRWARNRVFASGDTRNHSIVVSRTINKATERYLFNQVDADAIASAVRYAEWLLLLQSEGDTIPTNEFDMPHLQPKIWSESTYRISAESRNDAAQPLMDQAEQAGMLSAGYVQIQAGGHAVLTSGGLRRYYPYTTAQYSVTVREPKGTGSGWAGVDFNDWNRIDTRSLTQLALQKCLTSTNPVRVEPGRYTTILEPQAVADLFAVVIQHLDREKNEEKPDFPFYLEPGQSKIGLKLLDERLKITSDVMDPDLGWVPFNHHGEPYLPATWFDRGVLTDLEYNHRYAVEALGVNEPLLNSHGYRMSGGNTSMEEMIASTKRGVLVTRFSHIRLVDRPSLLCSGYTRDGLWLVENGAISKAIRNFQFTESPLFAFNNVQQIGPAQRVFSPGGPAVVPSMKVEDFSFTSMTDAI